MRNFHDVFWNTLEILISHIIYQCFLSLHGGTFNGKLHFLCCARHVNHESFDQIIFEKALFSLSIGQWLLILRGLRSRPPEVFGIGCSPVNLPHIFRTPFPRNAYGGLLLRVICFSVRVHQLKIHVTHQWRVVCWCLKTLSTWYLLKLILLLLFGEYYQAG